MSFTVNQINAFDELNALKQEWNALLNKSKDKTIFLTHEWIVNWWKCFGQDKELFVLIVKNNERIVGIVPLMLKNKKIKFIGTPQSDYCDFIIGEKKEGVLKVIYEYLLKNKKLWNSISLEEIPENSSSLSLSKNILKGMGGYFDIVFSNKCLSFEFSTDFQGLKKRDVTRNINGFKKKGTLMVDSVTDLHEALDLLNILFEQHIKIWAERGNESMFKEDKYKEFLIKLTNELLPKSKVNIVALKFNQKPISIHFGFSYNNKFLAYCQSHDLEYSKRGPATILNKFLLDHYFAAGFSEVDFSRGTESYKYRFTNKITTNLGITIQKNIIAYILNKSYNKIKEEIMKHEKLHKFANKYKNKIIDFFSSLNNSSL